MNFKVWWIPQIPMPRFEVAVESLVEARLLLDALAQYDLFQFRHNVKPDYANAGGLLAFDPSDKQDGPEGSWSDWYDEDGKCIDDFTLEDLRSARLLN